jgi:hypothetical protein
MNKPANRFKRVFYFLLIFKIAYLILVSAALLHWPLKQDPRIFHSASQHWTPEGYLTFGSHFGSWDAEHYLYLSKMGYHKGLGACACYPLWPLLIRMLSTFVGGNHMVAGILFANVFSFAGSFLFFKMVQLRLGEPIAWLSLLLLLVFPGSLFYQFIYAESLFFFLVILLCFALEQGYYRLSLVPAFLLPLTRAPGIFCVFPIMWYLFMQLPTIDWAKTLCRGRWGGQLLQAANHCRGQLYSSKVPRKYGLLLILMPILGWATYFTLMWKWTGNPIEGFEVQKYWGVHSISNIFNVPKFVIGFFDVPLYVSPFNVIFLDRFVFLLMCYCVPILWRLDKSWLIWMIVLGVVPAMSGTFICFTRYACVVFPFFIALAVFLIKSQMRLLRWTTLTLFAVLHVVLVWQFVNFRWVG